MSFITQPDSSQNIDVIDLVKNHSKIQQLLTIHPQHEYQVTVEQMDLGGQCGFVGCDWHRLVSVVITAKRSNSPSINVLAKVSGQTPNRGQSPNIEFMQLKPMNDDQWQSLNLNPKTSEKQ